MRSRNYLELPGGFAFDDAEFIVAYCVSLLTAVPSKETQYSGSGGYEIDVCNTSMRASYGEPAFLMASAYAPCRIESLMDVVRGNKEQVLPFTTGPLASVPT